MQNLSKLLVGSFNLLNKFLSELFEEKRGDGQRIEVQLQGESSSIKPILYFSLRLTEYNLKLYHR